MDRITKCRLVGYTYLAIVTIVEIVMFCTMFNIDGQHWGKLLAVVLTPIIFNIAIWGVAILYYKVKNKSPQ